MPDPASTSSRRPAAERRVELIEVATHHFGVSGYNGTSTETLARAAGISQAYLFRLFGTKRELFLACHDALHARIRASFEQAAAESVELPGEQRLWKMGRAYEELLRDRSLLLFQMQGYAACADPVIQAKIRASFAEIVEFVEFAGGLTGADAPLLWRFFSTGMLLNVVASLDLAQVAGEHPWAARWCEANFLPDLIDENGASAAEPEFPTA